MRGQIWVETVVYMLIGLSIIGILLAVVKPAIEKKQDHVLIEQGVGILNNLESAIEEVRYYGPGNSRIIDVRIKKGKLEVNSREDSIKFLMDSKYMYSEPEQLINISKISVFTKKRTNNYLVELKLNYSSSLDLTWNNQSTIKTLQPAPTVYNIKVTNTGIDNRTGTGEPLQIDFS